jgi:hypothetical protein
MMKATRELHEIVQSIRLDKPDRDKWVDSTLRRLQ